MFCQVYRSDHFNPPFANVKSIHKKDKVDFMHNPLLLHCLPNDGSTHNLAYKCNTFFVGTSTARLNHYRSNHSDTKDLRSYANTSVMDTPIWRYRDDLIANTNQAIKAIHVN